MELDELEAARSVADEISDKGHHRAYKKKATVADELESDSHAFSLMYSAKPELYKHKGRGKITKHEVAVAKAKSRYKEAIEGAVKRDSANHTAKTRSHYYEGTNDSVPFFSKDESLSSETLINGSDAKHATNKEKAARHHTKAPHHMVDSANTEGAANTAATANTALNTDTSDSAHTAPSYGTNQTLEPDEISQALIRAMLNEEHADYNEEDDVEYNFAEDKKAHESMLIRRLPQPNQAATDAMNDDASDAFSFFTRLAQNASDSSDSSDLVESGSSVGPRDSSDSLLSLSEPATTTDSNSSHSSSARDSSGARGCSLAYEDFTSHDGASLSSNFDKGAGNKQWQSVNGAGNGAGAASLHGEGGLHMDDSAHGNEQALGACLGTDSTVVRGHGADSSENHVITIKADELLASNRRAKIHQGKLSARELMEEGLYEEKLEELKRRYTWFENGPDKVERFNKEAEALRKECHEAALNKAYLLGESADEIEIHGSVPSESYEHLMGDISNFYTSCSDDLLTKREAKEQYELLKNALSSVKLEDLFTMQRKSLYDPNNERLTIKVTAKSVDNRVSVGDSALEGMDNHRVSIGDVGLNDGSASSSTAKQNASTSQGNSNAHSSGADGFCGFSGAGGEDGDDAPFSMTINVPGENQIQDVELNNGDDVVAPRYHPLKRFYNDLCEMGYALKNNDLEALFTILELDPAYYHKTTNGALTYLGSLNDGDYTNLLSGIDNYVERLKEREYDDDYILDDGNEADVNAKRRFLEKEERKRTPNSAFEYEKRLHPERDLGAEHGSMGFTYGFSGEDLEENGFLKTKVGELGEYSPTLMDIIDGNKILYVNLSCLTDATNGQNVGKLILTSLAYCAGKLNAEHRVPEHRVSVFVDEASELADESLVQMLNKSRSANFALMLATQSYADLVQRTESKERAAQIMANCNNLICMRVNDVDSAEVVTKLLAPTVVCERSSTISYTSDGSKLQNMSTSHTLNQKQCALFEPSLLPQLPDFEFIARLANGACYKGFVPIISEPPKQFANIVKDYIKENPNLTLTEQPKAKPDATATAMATFNSIATTMTKAKAKARTKDLSKAPTSATTSAPTKANV